MVLVPYDHITVLEGDSVELVFEVSGHPFPDPLIWLYNGDPLNISEDLSIVNTSLVFRVTSRRDSGNYTLMARNIAGVDSASIQLEVACQSIY